MYESRPGVKLYYYYDSYGNLSAIRYVLPDGTNGSDGTNEIYYITTNAQGDVLGIYTSQGIQVAAYEYDAWGNCTVFDVTQGSDGNNIFTEVTYSESQKLNMEFLNPFRYRGYYYDQDMGLYYLQSRYYDPQVGRFINADDFYNLGIDLTILSFNMYQYCNNSPIIFEDRQGEFLCAAIGAVVGAATSAIFASMEAGRTSREIMASAVNGAVSGAITGLASDIIIVTGGTGAVVIAAGAAAGFLGSGIGTYIEQKILKKDTTDPQNLIEIGVQSVLGGAFGALGGLMSGPADAMMEAVTKQASQKALTRGITLKFAIKMTVKEEFSKIFDTSVSEIISNVISSVFSMIFM